MLTVAMGVMAVVFIGAFGYAYVSYGNKVATANQLANQRQALQAQLAEARANVTALTAQRADLQLKAQQDEANITALNSSITKLNADVTSLTSQKADLEVEVSDLNTIIATLNFQIFTLNSQITDLQSVVDLKVSTAIVTSQQFSVSAMGCVNVASVPNSHAGYLLLTFSSSATDIFIGVGFDAGCASGLDASIVYVFPSGTSGTYKIPIAPTGSGAYVFVGSFNSMTVTGTITVVEYT